MSRRAVALADSSCLIVAFQRKKPEEIAYLVYVGEVDYGFDKGARSSFALA